MRQLQTQNGVQSVMKHQLAFHIAKTWSEAAEFVRSTYEGYSPYMRHKYKEPTALDYKGSDGSEGVIVWYHR